MVYIEDWQPFLHAAQAMFTAAPDTTRFLLKYRHIDGSAVVKITDDVKTIKYRTHEKEDLRYIDKLQTWIMTESCNPERVGSAAASAGEGGTASVSTTTAGAGSGGAKSSKPAKAPKKVPGPRLSGAQRRKQKKAAGVELKKSAAMLSREVRHKAQRERKRARRMARKLHAASSDTTAVVGAGAGK